MSEQAATSGARDFRRALGNYPTGVSVVASRALDGTPVAMVVGTFTSVSLDPPLVGFLPDRSSTTWPRIRETGRFSVSVLAADQEKVCRAFVTKASDRFDMHADENTAAGNPRVRGAVLWVDCDIEDVLQAGDHDMVLGRVRELAVPDRSGLPLLFVRGGYGAPSLPSIQAEGPGLGAQLRLADLVRPEAEAIARDLGLECLVSGVVDDSVVSLAAAGIGTTPGGSGTRVGATFPLAAPFGPLFAAWADEAQQQAWRERGARLTGMPAGRNADSDLRAVRDLGYQVTTGHAAADRFEHAVTAADADPAAVLRDLVERGPEPGLRRPVEQLSEVTSLAAPVRDGAGRVVLSLHLMGFSGAESPARLRACLERLLVGAARADGLLSA
ncbi:flavin reductase [Streptomyces heilongjiangensis]|uniref:Flavin reductase n=3 Tax=Streptomyces heilongjiangensis TaxID=945052 RepID=A0ABW1BIL1_9ACTN